MLGEISLDYDPHQPTCFGGMIMKSSPDLAAVAALIADSSRAAMLSALMGGYSLPAGDLARIARISPQTASAHLARLVSGGLLSVTKAGRHRYYVLRSKDVANV